MTAPVKTRKARSFGKKPWNFVPAGADIQNPTLAELNAVTGINVSLSLLSSFSGLGSEPSKVDLPAFLGETETYEANGTRKVSMGNIEAGVDPQAATGSEDKKAYEFFENGFVGWAWTAPGLDAKTHSAAALTDFVTIVPVEVDDAFVTESGEGEGAIFSFTAGVSVTGPIAQLVQPTA